MDKFKGEVLLIVNLASACGFTPQYTELQGLYEKYKNRKFQVLGFPCNQFGSQEPGSNAGRAWLNKDKEEGFLWIGPGAEMACTDAALKVQMFSLGSSFESTRFLQGGKCGGSIVMRTGLSHLQTSRSLLGITTRRPSLS
eukprot:1153556-Pelagomonas_calceolata.AAC.5